MTEAMAILITVLTAILIYKIAFHNGQDAGAQDERARKDPMHGRATRTYHDQGADAAATRPCVDARDQEYQKEMKRLRGARARAVTLTLMGAVLTPTAVALGERGEGVLALGIMLFAWCGFRILVLSEDIRNLRRDFITGGSNAEAS